jgi:hypothetical protein
MNWNSPSNFQLNIEGQGSRLEIKPFEKSTFYQGMEIVEPSNKVPVRTYIPKKISELNSFPKQKDAIKPGFLEQALEMKSILKGKQPKVSASLEDAFNVQKILDNILSN